MKAYTYKVTKSTLNDYKALHLTRGYAYQTDSHFVHLYGVDITLRNISVGLTATESINGTLLDWIEAQFGAEDIQEMVTEVGHITTGIWRPALFYHDDLTQGLVIEEPEMKTAEQSLRLLLGQLDELFLYIDPNARCLNTFGYKTRQLLILACTEIESSWKLYMNMAGVKPMNKLFTTKDYVKLVQRLKLAEFQFILRGQGGELVFRPFETWNAVEPTKSIPWYKAYNDTKHDKVVHFAEATLETCINAVVANLIFHCVRFSPYSLTEKPGILQSLVLQHFKIELIDCDYRTFYLHKFNIPRGTITQFTILNPVKQGWVEPFQREPLVL